MLLGIFILCMDVYGNEPVIFENTIRSIVVMYELFNDSTTAITIYCITFWDSLFTKIPVMKLLWDQLFNISWPRTCLPAELDIFNIVVPCNTYRYWLILCAQLTPHCLTRSHLFSLLNYFLISKFKSELCSFWHLPYFLVRHWFVRWSDFFKQCLHNFNLLTLFILDIKSSSKNTVHLYIRCGYWHI